MNPNTLSDPVLSQIMELHSSKNILLLEEDRIRTSSKNLVGRYQARKGKGDEREPALQAVQYLEKSLNISLADKKCISVRRARQYIANQPYNSVQPESASTTEALATDRKDPESPPDMPSAPDKMVQENIYPVERFASVEIDRKISTTAGSDNVDNVVVGSRSPNSKGYNVTFSETTATITEMVRQEDAFFEDILSQAHDYKDYPEGIEAQFRELSPEAMVEFRQYLLRTFALDELESRLPNFLYRSSLLLVLGILNRTIQCVPQGELSSAVSHYSDTAKCYQYLLTFFWLRTHLGTHSLWNVVQDTCRFLSHYPNYFNDPHATATQEIKDTLQQKGAPEWIRKKMTYDFDDPQRQEKARAAWKQLFLENNSRNQMFEELGLHEWINNENAHDIATKIAREIFNDVLYGQSKQN